MRSVVSPRSAPISTPRRAPAAWSTGSTTRAQNGYIRWSLRAVARADEGSSLWKAVRPAAATLAGREAPMNHEWLFLPMRASNDLLGDPDALQARMAED